MGQTILSLLIPIHLHISTVISPTDQFVIIVGISKANVYHYQLSLAIKYEDYNTNCYRTLSKRQFLWFTTQHVKT